jgi:hypothetical protein
MGFKIIAADPAKHEDKVRVTTLRYLYKLRGLDGEDLWRAHWHPDGNSSVVEPHMHMLPDLKLHFAIPRVSLEQTIQWCIQLGAPLSCTPVEAANILAETQWPHMLYRTWSNSPHERRQAQA